MFSMFAHVQLSCSNSDVKLTISYRLIKILTFPHILNQRRRFSRDPVRFDLLWAGRLRNVKRASRWRPLKVLSGSRWSRRPRKVPSKGWLIGAAACSAHSWRNNQMCLQLKSACGRNLGKHSTRGIAQNKQKKGFSKSVQSLESPSATVTSTQAQTTWNYCFVQPLGIDSV